MYLSDADVMDDVGNSAKGALWADVNQENPSIAGAAYKARRLMTILTSSQRGGWDCSAETDIKEGALNVHVPEYRQCQRVIDKSIACDVIHEYDSAAVRYNAGPFNIKSCGDGCNQIWIGRVGDNYWAGSCKIYEEYTQVQVNNPDAIISATLEYAKWDDYM